MLAWLDPEAVTARLLDGLKKDIAGALTAEERTRRVKELKRKIDRAEREEEAAIEASLAQGFIVHRRIDTNPAAILAVRVVKKVRAGPRCMLHAGSSFPARETLLNCR